jgi:hypothetical protein
MSGRQLPILEPGFGTASRPGFPVAAGADVAGPLDARLRPAQPDDPVELVGVPIPIDDAAFDEMALTFVEEFVRDGWGNRQLLAMFGAPMYAGLHLIWQVRGEAWVRDLIAATRERWGRPDPDLQPRPPEVP